ncbi:unnamed protein product [Cuscuta epithymum]|uniref:Peptidase A1 domain-containing protein n=1 Tax=Cuscuta epithymum TaxID=186058 RepID=A0AAV0GMC4_9ASTE|nr:unnamed protein product [Cuscuta epithymum]
MGVGRKRMVRLQLMMLLAFQLVSASFFMTSSAAAGVQFQTMKVIPLAATQQPRPQTQRPAAIPSDATEDPATAAIELDFLNIHVDTLTPAELNDLDHEALFHKRMKSDAARARALSMQAKRAAAAGGGGSAITGDAVSGASLGILNYFTSVWVGTPSPQKASLILDTGSDLIWMQCRPCKNCYKQKDPIFNPVQSRSYADLGCDDPSCQLLIPDGASTGCATQHSQRSNIKTTTSRQTNSTVKVCPYRYRYGDGSTTFGHLFKDTLMLGGSKVNISLGCGVNNTGLFGGTAGLLGLGRGKYSFPGQLAAAGGRYLTYSQKFSVCLPSDSRLKSTIVFGDSEEVKPSKNATSTPLLKNPFMDTFYYLQLEGISVAGERVPGVESSLFKLNATGDGGLIIDSGTVLTRLNPIAYNRMRDAFRNAARNLTLLTPSKGDLFDTCYSLAGFKEDDTLEVPTVTMHFKGADVALDGLNYMIGMNVNGTAAICFAFLPSDDSFNIFGNMQHLNFRVTYDVQNSKVVFDPDRCS